MIRLLFARRLRQTEGLLESIMKLMGLILPVPDHTTLSRRMKELQIKDNVPQDEGPLVIIIDSSGLKIYGEGEWNQLKRGAKQKKSWRKLHLVINGRGKIVGKMLTDHTVGDSSCVNGFLDQVDGRVDVMIGDGGYDGNPTYDKIEAHQPSKVPKIIIPPKKHSRIRKKGNKQRNSHIEFIRAYGREIWEIQNDYRKRLRVENTFFRYKTLIGRKLHSRDFDCQEVETSAGCKILNKMHEIGIGMPVSVPA